MARVACVALETLRYTFQIMGLLLDVATSVEGMSSISSVKSLQWHFRKIGCSQERKIFGHGADPLCFAKASPSIKPLYTELFARLGTEGLVQGYVWIMQAEPQYRSLSLLEEAGVGYSVMSFAAQSPGS